MASTDQGNSPRKPTPVTPTTADQTGDITTDAQAGAAAGSTEGNGAGAGDTDADHLIEVRVLRDHGEYKANTVAALTEAEVKAGEGDWLDSHADAVAYLKSQDA